MKSLFILTSALLFTANVLAENDPLSGNFSKR
jgi:hypothetical protein